MPRRRILRHIQVTVLSITVLAVAGIICGLLWLNQRGFSGEWSEQISAELSAQGIHADFEEVRFSPLRGLIVTNSIIYTDESRQTVYARIPSLKIDVDRAKALRGELLFRKCQLRDAEFIIPLVKDEENPVKLTLKHLTGELSVDRQGRLLLKDANGVLGGMNFTLNAELTNFEPTGLGKKAESNSDASRKDFLDRLLAELAFWDFPEDRAPDIDIDITGDLLSTTTLKTTFTLKAAELTRHDYTMKEITLEGQFFGHRATLDRFEFSEGAGRFISQADYDVLRKEGHYNIESSIHLSRMLNACFQIDPLANIITARASIVEGEGDFRIASDDTFRVTATGSIELQRFSFLGTSYEGLDTDFSWQDGDLYLRHLHAAHEHGSLTGQVLIQGDVIRYQTESSLPINAFKPFIKPGGGIEKIISRATFTPETTIMMTTNGTIQRSDLREWAASGKAHFENLSYRGVPLRSAQANYSINPLESSFSEVTIDFDYSDSPLRKLYGGPRNAIVKADRIAYDQSIQQTTLDNVRGTAWPGPVLRLFLPKTADHIEEDYRFRSPPSFTTNGPIGHFKNIGKTDVRTSISAGSTTNYTLLGKSLSLDRVRALVRYRHRLVDVTDLSFNTFQGSGGGDVSVRIRPGQSSQIKVGIRWTRLRLADIGKTYGFEKAKQGAVTGRIDFTSSSGDVRTMDGTGAIGLENGHLFFVPVLGPLSTIIGGVVGDKRASHEEARNASCTFAIRNGVVYTRDFLTTTPSTVFTGAGSIDLHRKAIDMVIRMNAKGLFGLLTLPLRPFNGLFQFRGQGPLANPTWNSAAFVAPPDGKNDPIFHGPGRAKIIRER